MTEKREMPNPMDSTESEVGLPRAGINLEEDDLYAQLAQKEQDLILAAELGKALLDSNQDLQSRFDQMVDDYTHKVEELQQEKYDLHIELEKRQAEYQNAIKDLQDDVTALSKQARASDEYQMSERERSRSLREAQQNSDYLLEQVKKASLKEEEFMKELNQLKIRNESNSATIKDQMDHISMLRDQVEYLSEKLREANQNCEDIQGEKDVLVNTLEMTQESTQVLEMKLSEQEVKIQRQANDIEELQESNSQLLQQLQQQMRTPYNGNRSGNNNRHNNFSSNRPRPQKSLCFEVNQEKQKQSNSHPQSQAHQQQKLNLATHPKKQFDDCDEIDQAEGMTKPYEKSLFAKLNLGDGRESNPSHPLLTELSSMCHHNRSTADCHICCVTEEGSRKRLHQTIVDGSDDDDDDTSDSGPKQSLYADSFDSIGAIGSAAIDSNGNKLSYLISSQFDTHNPCHLDARIQSTSAELFQRRNTRAHAELQDSPPLSASESFPKSCLPLNSCKENVTFADIQSQLDDTSDSSGENEKTLFSELSQFTHEFYPRQQEVQEQSLFSELSTQLYDDRNGTGSDSSSNCMLGVFDFSGSDAQDVDRNSNESLNRSMEIRSRIESDMSYVSDWYYMTPVTSEMLEEDDFECDDDDFQIGNLPGTTLSISGSDHGLRYHYHGYIPGEDITDPDCGAYDVDEIFCSKEPEIKDHNKQAQLSEACRQLKELVVRCQGEGCQSVSKPLGARGGYWDASTDMLLSLVAEMRVCVDKLTGCKEEQLQSADISTTVKNETAIIAGACSTGDPPLQDTSEQLLQQQDKNRDASGNQLSSTDLRKDARKQMKKSKSSSSLV